MKDRLRSFGQQTLPLSMRRAIVRYTTWPPIGLVRFGSLRRLKPISSDWGMERGSPIDRYYIERFLALHSMDVKGHVLEIGNDRYTRRYGQNRVDHSDVLHVSEQQPGVTIVGDLTNAGHIKSDNFDCIILTQTLQFIFDVPAALMTVCRILKPGGIALVTVPGISNISRYDMDRWGQYWCFTTKSIGRLFESNFSHGKFEIYAHGNVLAATAFLQGIAAEELRRKELEFNDPDYEVLITVRAEKEKALA